MNCDAVGSALTSGWSNLIQRMSMGLTVRKTHEIDFVVNRGSERYYIQSAYEIPDSEKMAQEKASLNRIGDSFKKIIVVRDYMKPRIDETGIVSVGLINFLLDDRILS